MIETTKYAPLSKDLSSDKETEKVLVQAVTQRH